MIVRRWVIPELRQGHSRHAVQPVGDDNSESAVRFLIKWVSDGQAAAAAQGMLVTLGDLVIWLVKDLAS
jgi:hypothetical protein